MDITVTLTNGKTERFTNARFNFTNKDNNGHVDITQGFLIVITEDNIYKILCESIETFSFKMS